MSSTYGNHVPVDQRAAKHQTTNVCNVASDQSGTAVRETRSGLCETLSINHLMTSLVTRL